MLPGCQYRSFNHHARYGARPALDPTTPYMLAWRNGLMRMSATGEVLWKFIGDEESLHYRRAPQWR